MSTTAHRTRLALLVFAALALPAHAPARAATVTFSVTVPANTPPADTVYIAGDFQGWNPGDPAYALTDQGANNWAITLNLPDGIPIQYKYTRGSWAQVEKGPNGEEIANRAYLPSGTPTINDTVASWADLGVSTITGHVEWFEHAPFLSGRRCWVYLPPNYFQSTDTYPVLYMHDGQNLFDVATSFSGEWQVDEACQALITAGEIEPIIVVGIENAGALRCFEYTPFADPALPCSGGGDTYLQQIRNVLIPEVNARYRTRTGPANTFISGSSLGGMITLYAAYAHPDVFGRIAALSSSFWAQGDIYNFAAIQGRAPTFERFYHDMGTLEDIPGQNAMQAVALAQGFIEGDDLLTVEGIGHQHNEFYWAQRFPDLLRFLINSPNEPCDGDANNDNTIDVNDISYVLFRLGNAGPDGDANGDGTVDVNDISHVLFHLGQPC